MKMFFIKDLLDVEDWAQKMIKTGENWLISFQIETFRNYPILCK